MPIQALARELLNRFAGKSVHFSDIGVDKHAQFGSPAHKRALQMLEQAEKVTVFRTRRFDVRQGRASLCLMTRYWCLAGEKIVGLKTPIEWTETTWNPLTGCTKVSPGCKRCYAERMSKRLRAMGQRNYRNGFELTLHEHMLSAPLSWKKPQMVFVNSMSDLFQDGVSVEFIQRVFETMRNAHWHQFQVLTKRSERLLDLNHSIDWPPNVWMGVSVENEKYTFRIDHLRRTDAVVKFLSMEPLLGPLHNLNPDGIDWGIVGGESGPGARPVNPDWVTDIRDQCEAAGVAFFFKQWGGVNKKKSRRMLEGKFYNEMPPVREQLPLVQIGGAL